MKVFITGATGYIGGAVARVLRGSGHEVSALVRASSDTRRLREEGVAIIAGELGDLPNLGEAVAAHDVWIHAAFAAGPDAVALDRVALETFLQQPRGHFIYTSGVWIFGNTGEGLPDEDSPLAPLEISAWRVGHEKRVLENDGALTTVSIRPGCVYGRRQSLLADWFVSAEGNGPISIVGEGDNRWAMVHIEELADLYLRAVEGRAGGVLHGIDDSHESLNEMALALVASRESDCAIEHIAIETAREQMGVFADALAVDQNISSRKTRERLGWKPSLTFVSSLERQWEEWRDSIAGLEP
jgi:nucleoside-diphosphate-sugar epimerase